MLLERPFPNASACILVGRADAAHFARIRGYERIAWIVDAAGQKESPAGVRREALQVVTLETIATNGLQPWLDRFLAKSPRHLPSLYVTAEVEKSHTEAYRAILDLLHRFLEGHHRARITRQKDGFTWQRHLLENISAYAERRLPNSWAGVLRGIPAFVCGAGPSLDVSGPQLARVADRGVIFSADSALRSLAKLGVRADFVVSVDAAKTPDKCLPADVPAPTRVALSAVSPPAWRKALPESSPIFLSSNQVTLDWLSTHGIARTAVAVAENCGATALELARYLGCSPIYTFGLDLALDANAPAKRNTSGADTTLYSNSGFDAQQEFPRVPGNYTETVPTHVLGDYHALDARLANWPADLVRNVTDRGARLRNTTLVQPAELTVPAGPDKAAALALLAPSTVGSSYNPFDADTALLRLQSIGARARDAVPRLRTALEKHGPDAVATTLRQLFSDQDLGRGLGAFSLKIMPHLVPPIAADVEFWRSIIHELQILADLAVHAGSHTESSPTSSTAV